MSPSPTRALIVALTLAALGCDDLDLDDEDKTASDAGVGAPSAPAAPTDTGAATASGEAARELTVDATERPPVWVFLDLDTGAQNKDEAALAGWDVALQRSNIRLRDGGRANLIAGARFESVTEAPSEGWAADTPGEKPVYFLSSGDTGWYDYDTMTHALTPRPNVYVVQTSAGFQKLAVLGWTNEAGTTGVFRLKTGKVAAPPYPISGRDAEVDVSTGASVGYDAGTDGGNGGSARSGNL